MKSGKNVEDFLVEVGAFLLIVVVIVSTLFLKVWKEEHNKQYARSYTTSTKRLNRLTSECATLEVAISELSTSQRLSRYAEDTLGLALPTSQQIISVYRESSGKLVGDDEGFWGHFIGLFFRGGH